MGFVEWEIEFIDDTITFYCFDLVGKAGNAEVSLLLIWLLDINFGKLSYISFAVVTLDAT